MKWKNRNPKLSSELTRLSRLTPNELLGVPVDASLDEIKKAYRQMIKVYHPDKSDPFMKAYNEQVVILINNAYKHITSRFKD
jgi:DnaJ-class molecular chaperone